MDKRELFIIRPHSIVDIITNSSSELFICNTKKTVAEVKEILQGLVMVYNAAKCGTEDEYCYGDFDSIFGEIKIAEESNFDEYGFGESYEKGDLLIFSAEDNSVPYAFFEFIEQIFDARRIHLG